MAGVGGFRSYEECMHPRLVHNCSYCGSPFTEVGKTGCYCIPCKAASYCGAECQRKHWPVHKSMCRAESQRRFDVSLAFAERGSSMAMFYLANFYMSGYGTKKNSEEAMRWATRAAEKGHPEAMYNLSTYYRCAGGDDNVEQAVHWMRRSAMAGLAQAQLCVAKRHVKDGPEEDFVKAATWLRRAADQGQPRAARLLAEAYIRGHGVPVDHEEAIRLLRVVAATGDSSSTWALSQLLLFTQEKLRDTVEATHYLHRAAFMGFQEAQVMLGREYSAEAPGPVSALVPLDKPQALAWYKYAAAGPAGPVKDEADAGVRRLEDAGVVAMVLSGVQR